MYITLQLLDSRIARPEQTCTVLAYLCDSNGAYMVATVTYSAIWQRYNCHDHATDDSTALTEDDEHYILWAYVDIETLDISIDGGRNNAN